MSAGAGGAIQAHAAFLTPDDRHILVANQNGKLLERIDTDYTTNTYVHATAATIDLANCTTPNGFPCQDPVLRPDNAPICPIVESTSRYVFVFSASVGCDGGEAGTGDADGGDRDGEGAVAVVAATGEMPLVEAEKGAALVAPMG